ncbi:MAG: hypothetical protein HQ552_07615 [Desulfobacteraceae bacterium]|nr:hypothetical protein [Desulfobacteraceae bacterium]
MRSLLQLTHPGGGAYVQTTSLFDLCRSSDQHLQLLLRGLLQREGKAYWFWLTIVAYGKEIVSKDEKIDLCAELESKDRTFHHFRGLLGILLFTIAISYLVFQFYSFHYIFISAPLYELGAFTDYVWYNTIIGFIVMINCLELLYIRVAVEKTEGFPFFKIRPRVTGRDRLSKVWMIMGCSKLKTPEYAITRTPREFYDNQEFYSKEKDRI